MGDLTPITREEYYLARMAGEDVTMPEPITREEEYMKGIAAQIEAGASELPAVTDVDEGKILAVNENGKWDKADAPIELPEVTDVDEGKVLTVNASGEWDKADAPTELPEVTTSDNGDVLTVVEGVWAKADAPKELPTVTSSDNGKVLTVDEVSGDVVWQTPSSASFTPLTVNILRTTMVWNNSYIFNGYAFLDFCFTKNANTEANSVVGDWDDLPKIANTASGSLVDLTAYEVSGTTTQDIRGVTAYNGASAASLCAGNIALPAGTSHVSGSYKLATS